MSAEDPLARLGRNDVTDLAGLGELVRAADPEGALSPLELRELQIGPGLLAGLPALLERLGASGRVVVAGDATPIAAGGRDVKEAVTEILGAERVCLGDDLHADEASLEAARGALAGAGCVVAVGSGTLSDVCKAVVAPSATLVLVQTAGSVNGFSDAVSVLLRAGVKRTVPTRWADALVVDLDVLAAAPPAMNAAGFGDALATWTAAGDWRLAGLTGLDPAWHPAPSAMVRPQARELLEAAAGVPGRDPGALDRLARVLTLGGLAVGLTGGRTAVLSGAEHLVSHLLDMDAGARGARVALHGAQVGLATVLLAVVWELALEELEPAREEVRLPSPEAVRAEIDLAFAHLDPEGRMREECWRDCERKLERAHARREAIARVVRDWDEHREELRALTLPPERLVAAMRRCGAPLTFERLDPPVAPETGRWALRHCHLMRDRFTVVDLLAALGRWDDAVVDAILARAAHLLGAPAG